MALLTNRPNTVTSLNDMTGQDDSVLTNRRISSPPNGNAQARTAAEAAGAASVAAVPTAEALHTLHTLKARLDAQVNGSEVNEDPETRFILVSARRRLNQVNTALARIEEGKYGICADCHKMIENDRLVLQPFVTRCTVCQNIAEWRGLTY